MDKVKRLQDRLNHLKSDLAEAKLVKLDKVLDQAKINKLKNQIETLNQELDALKNQY